MNKEEIIDAYLGGMMKGCMCKNPDKKLFNDLVKRYEDLGGTEGDLIFRAIQKQASINNVKITSGTLGYPTM